MLAIIFGLGCVAVALAFYAFGTMTRHGSYDGPVVLIAGATGLVGAVLSTVAGSILVEGHGLRVGAALVIAGTIGIAVAMSRSADGVEQWIVVYATVLTIIPALIGGWLQSRTDAAADGPLSGLVENANGLLAAVVVVGVVAECVFGLLAAEIKKAYRR